MLHHERDYTGYTETGKSMKTSSLVAPKIGKMTTFGATNDEYLIKITQFCYQCMGKKIYDISIISMILFLNGSESI